MTNLGELPLNIDPAFMPSIHRQLVEISEGDQERHTDDTFYGLIDSVSDALHLGRIDFGHHDTLIKEIRDAHDKWLDIVDPRP